MLRDDVLRTVLYFDVFSWPLTCAEIARFVRPGDLAAVEHVCGELVGAGLLASDGPFVFVSGRGDLVAERRTRNANAERRWPDAQRAAAILARVPYVRAVLITGGLSKGSADRDADVDFMLIVEPGRVWTAKSMLQIARWPVPIGVRDLFCTNYLVAEDALLLDDRTAYTAIELATAVPMWNGALCGRLLAANGWAEAFVPGWAWAVERAKNAPDLPPRRGARLVERALALGGDGLDQRALAVWDRYWNRKYAFLDAPTRAQRFKRRPDRATNHLDDYQGRVVAAWRERLLARSVPEPTLPELPV